MITKEVGISGTVGKQTYATTIKKRLLGLSMFPKTSAASVTIRDGNASGAVVLTHSSVANDSGPVVFPQPIRFDKGMHVKVLGTTGALCYLFID